jgi:hypothetical protein
MCNAANQAIQKGAAISLHWVPGHKDVAGNEKADSLAKLAAKKLPSSDITSVAKSWVSTFSSNLRYLAGYFSYLDTSYIQNIDPDLVYRKSY